MNDEREAYQARNRRKLPRVVIGVFVICFLGTWAPGQPEAPPV